MSPSHVGAARDAQLAFRLGRKLIRSDKLQPEVLLQNANGRERIHAAVGRFVASILSVPCVVRDTLAEVFDALLSRDLIEILAIAFRCLGISATGRPD